MEIQLYKSFKFKGLIESNKLSNINIQENKDLLNYIFHKYERIDNIIDRLSNIDLNEIPDNKGVMVIASRDNSSIHTKDKIDYIWEYYTNWVKLR
jgi:hypothetical protein